MTTFLMSEVLSKAFDSAAGAPFRMLLRKRMEVAREVLLADVRAGRALSSEHDLESATAMALRYLRAAEEGAARRNLRLMARVMGGLADVGEMLPADEFLRWTELIASLSREEIITCCTLLKKEREQIELGTESGNIPGRAVFEVASELVGPGRLFGSRAELDQTLGALTRTGLVLTGSGFGTIIFMTTPRMQDFAHLSDLEALFADGGLD